MTGKRMVTDHLTRAGLLEPFRRTLMCLQLRHSIFPGLDCDFFSLPQGRPDVVLSRVLPDSTLTFAFANILALSAGGPECFRRAKR